MSNTEYGADNLSLSPWLDDDEHQFVIDLDRLGVAVWVGASLVGTMVQPYCCVMPITPRLKGPEFSRPRGWQTLWYRDNRERIETFEPDSCLCANTGGRIAVVDVDPRNGGDIEKVRQLLADLKVRIFAEVITPGGGRHFYIAAHKDLASFHSIPDYPGVDIQAKGCNVFLPGTQRPKYGGRGYTIVFNDLAELAGDR